MMVGFYSYIADITTEKERTVRIGIISLVYSVGVPFGMAFSGILIRYFIHFLSLSFYLFFESPFQLMFSQAHRPMSKLSFYYVVVFSPSFLFKAKRMEETNKQKINDAKYHYFVLVHDYYF